MEANKLAPDLPRKKKDSSVLVGRRKRLKKISNLDNVFLRYVPTNSRIRRPSLTKLKYMHSQVALLRLKRATILSGPCLTLHGYHHATPVSLFCLLYISLKIISNQLLMPSPEVCVRLCRFRKEFLALSTMIFYMCAISHYFIFSKRYQRVV